MCLDSLKGRQNTCCFGCSTGAGLHLSSIVMIGELCLMVYFLASMAVQGDFSWTVLCFLGITLVRYLFYLPLFWSCCYDGIQARRNFLYTVFFTVIAEMALFVVMNFSLIGGKTSFCESHALTNFLVEDFGWSCNSSIAVIETTTCVNWLFFAYMISVAYEHYRFAADDPKMIQAEYKRRADMEIAEAKDRQKREQEARKSAENSLNKSSADNERPLLQAQNPS